MGSYYKFSQYLKDLYGEKVYKLPIAVKGTCPNRDPITGKGGCTFCAEDAQTQHLLSDELTIKQQLKINRDYIGNRYGAKKFISYFQNYTATFREPEIIRDMVIQAIEEDIVEVCLSTRPDCVEEEVLDVLSDIKAKMNVNITLELGLQSVNDRTLLEIRRGHTLEDYIDAVKRIKKRGFFVGTHIIANLPGDGYDEVIRAAKLFSELDIDRVKLHSLYISRTSQLAELYLSNKIDMKTHHDYLNRLLLFIYHLKKTIALERFFARAPEGDALFCNWNHSWRYLQNTIEELLVEKDIKQGDYYESKTGMGSIINSIQSGC